MKYSNFLSLSLVMLSGLLLICTVFAVDPNLENGLVSGKVHWFHWAMLCVAASTLITAIFTKKIRQYVFSPTDGLVLFSAAIVLLTYDWQLNPEPEKMGFGGQLIVLWFLLRFVFARWQQLRLFYLALIVGTGLIEALLGICQLYGFKSSNHSLFNLTGDFYNPGPYSGYLAVISPLCLWMILEFSEYKKQGWRQVKAYLYYLGWVSLLAIIIVLPAGMSRSAWIAVIFSCMWVYFVQRIGWWSVKQFVRRNKKISILFSVLIMIVMIGAMAGSYVLKKDSAHGRLLLWKVTGQAMMEQSYIGTGLGGFPAAYVNAQAVYFASGKALTIEKQVAGYPDYGFNEFLQIGLEQGGIGLLTFVLLLGYSLFQGVKNRQIGAAGGILSLVIFALASYPLQLPEFWVVLVILVGIVNAPLSSEILPVLSRKNKKIFLVVVFGLLLVCCGFVNRQEKYIQGYKKWKISKMLQNERAYEAAGEGYKELVPLMGHKPELLFEAALCLNREKCYVKANRLLYRAMKLGNDPMVCYVAAINEQLIGNYKEAEKILLHVINILPERIYPHYLLVKLYFEPDFYQKEKFFKAAEAVLKKKPKIESPAVREMLKEVKTLVQIKCGLTN